MLLRRWLSAGTGSGNRLPLVATRVPNFRAVNAQLMGSASLDELRSVILRPGQRFDDVNCATAFRCLAKFNSAAATTTGQEKQDAMQRLLALCDASKDFSGQTLSTALHSIAKAGLFAKVPPVLMAKIERFDFAKFDAQAVGNIMWAFARLNHHSSFVLHAFADSIASASSSGAAASPQRRNMGDFQPQNLANTMWGFATLGFSHEASRRVIGREILSRDLCAFRAQDLSNCLWAFATLHDDALCGAFARELVRRTTSFGTPPLRDFTPQALSNICWAFGVLEYGQTQCGDKDGGAATMRKWFDAVGSVDLRAFSSQHLTTVLSANAKVGRSQVLTDAVLRQMTTSTGGAPPLTRCSPQDLATLMWAASVLLPATKTTTTTREQQQTRGAALCSQVMEEVLLRRRLADFNPVDLSTLLSSLVTFNFKSIKFLHRVATEADFGKFPPLALSNTLRAFASFAYKPCDRICQAIVPPSASSSSLYAFPQSYSPQSVAMVFWACAQLELTNVDLCSQLYAAASSLQDDCFNAYSSQDLTMIVRAMAVLDCGERHAQLTNKIAREMCSRRGGFTLQGVSNALWAFACMDVLDQEWVQRLFQAREIVTESQQQPAAPPTLKDAQQLLHTRVAWEQHQRRQTTAAPSRLLNKLCEGGWVDKLIAEDNCCYDDDDDDDDQLNSGRQRRQSQAHQSIAAMLHQSFANDFQVEALVPKLGISVDMLIPSRRVVIEVDGPTHFYSQTGRPTGKTKFVRRLLERAGYRVYSIPVAKFQAMDHEEQVKLLKSLASVVVTED